MGRNEKVALEVASRELALARIQAQATCKLLEKYVAQMTGVADSILRKLAANSRFDLDDEGVFISKCDWFALTTEESAYLSDLTLGDPKERRAV
jgi:hypothetical protein